MREMPGMRCDAVDPPGGRLAAALQFEGEQQAGELGLAVDRHRSVASFGVDVGEINCSVPRGYAAERHDAARVPAAQQRKKPSRESKMTQMISAELKLESVLRGLSRGRHHDAGIVDEQVEPVRAAWSWPLRKASTEARLARSSWPKVTCAPGAAA